MGNKFTFKPAYGFGWKSGHVSIEVPIPFIVEGGESDSSIITGKIESTHPYEKRKVSLSLRSISNGVKHFNVVIHRESNKEEVTGFAELVT